MTDRKVAKLLAETQLQRQISSAVVAPSASTTISGLPAPSGWRCAEPWGSGLVWQRLFGSKISVIEDISVKADGKRWLHISVGAPNNRMPAYEDVQAARKAFIGEHRESYMVFPTKERYVNIGNVLHLWACLDEPEGVLPHFEGIIDGILTV